MEMLGRITKKLEELPANKLGILYDLLEKLTGPFGQQWWGELAKFLRRENLFTIANSNQEWQKFYRKYFRLRVDFSDVQIPDNSGGFDRIIFIPKGLKINDVFKAIKKHFPACSYVDDLDNDVVDNVRTTEQSYAIRLRERVEADEELKNISAKDLKNSDIDTITLLERLVLELKYWSETDQHLDITNITLCAGSRNRNGGVLYVKWDSRLFVHWFSLIDAHDDARARQVVS